MQDAAALVERRRDQTLAAKDAGRAEPLLEDVKMAHTVQEGQDRGIWTDRCGERVDGGIEVVGFASQQNQVERAVQFMGLHSGWRFEGYIAKAAFDYETGFSELSSPLRSDEKGDIATGLEQSAAKVSADRAGADDENSHNYFPSLLVVHFNTNIFVINANRAHLSITFDRTTP